MSNFLKHFKFPNSAKVSQPNGEVPKTPQTTEEVTERQVIEQNEVYQRELHLVLRELRSHASASLLLYGDSDDIIGQRFYAAFVALHDHVSKSGLEPALDYLMGIVHLFDLDPSVPGNGYRSMVSVIHRCCLRLITLVRYIKNNRKSYLFRAQHYSKELEAYVTTLGQLRACIHYLLKLIPFCPNGQLFPDEDKLSADEYCIAGRLLAEVEALCQESFYGRCLGFQFCDSMSAPLTVINLILASYSDGYEKTSMFGKIASSVMSSQKYAMDPELKAKRITEATRNGDLNFCKAFWGLAENPVLHKMPQFVCPSAAVDRVLLLEPEPLTVPLRDGSGVVVVHPPCAHSGPGSVSVRLISSVCRRGQRDDVRDVPAASEKLIQQVTLSLQEVIPCCREKRSENCAKAKTDDFSMGPGKMQIESDGLIVHVHGGGFVAQSSASHQVYLRHWAQDVGVPILSVDYSLAPEHPYPRQLEEVFYAYCWALVNANKLGWTGKKVCLVGDSAGATLAVAAALNGITYGVRLPDGILTVYGCLLVKYAPSPSRILAIMDPLLPIGVLPKCLGAYVGVNTQIEMTEIRDKRSSESLSRSSFYNCEDLENRSVSIENRSVSVSSYISAVDSDLTIKNSEGSAIMKEMTRDVVESSGEVFEDVLLDESLQMFNSTAQKDLPNGNSPEVMIIAEDQNDSVFAEGSMLVTSCSDSQIDRRKGCADDESSKVLCNGSATSQLDHFEMCASRTNSSTEVKNRTASVSKAASSPSFLTPPTSPMDQPFLSASSSPAAISPRTSFMSLCSIPTYAKTYPVSKSKFGEFHKLSVGCNPLMSPLLATDDVLRNLCPMFLLTCHLDPMLDDSVAFAKRLRQLGKFVHLDVVDGLPHGFLNFVLISAEAKAASTLCTLRIRHILDIDKNYTMHK